MLKSIGKNTVCSAVRSASSKGVAAVAQETSVKAAGTERTPSMHVLDNSFRVACFGNDSQMSSTAIHVEAGTRNETVPGVANFIARLAGKGTSTTKQEDLQNKLAKMGASLDVFVNREYTSFVVTGFSKDALEHASIVSDVVKNSVFDEEALESERKSVMLSVEQERDNISAVTMDYLYSVAYEGTPMSRNLTGSTANIQSISRSDLMSFIGENYRAPRMLLTSVGGSVDLDRLAESAQVNLGGVPNAFLDNGASYLKPCRFTAMEVQHRDDDLPLAHVAFAFNSCAYSSQDRVPLMVLAEMFGSHDKSHGALGQGLNKIGQVVQNPANGLYAARAFSHNYSDCGMFGVYYVATPEALNNAQIYINKFLRNQALNVVEQSLTRAKRSLRRKLIEDMYNPQAVQDKIAQDVFFGAGRPEALEEVINRIDSLTCQDVQDVAYEYIMDNEFARSAYGPTEAVYDYNLSFSGLNFPRW